MGFLGPEQRSSKDLKLENRPALEYQSEHEKYRTKPSEHLRRGDCRRGRASCGGRSTKAEVRRECDRFLMGFDGSAIRATRRVNFRFF